LTAPTGTISSTSPTFTWNAVPNGEWYYLWISGVNGKVLDQWTSVSSICSSGVCQITPTLNLPAGSYRWWVQAWGQVAGYGAWSAQGDFTVAGSSPEFDPPLEIVPTEVPEEQPTPELTQESPG